MTRARRLIVVVAICLMAALAAPVPLRAVPPPHAPRAAVVGSTGWIQQILDAIGGRRVSVAVGVDGVTWFDHGGDVPRQPASNEKLLLSMALLDRLPATMRIRTQAAARTLPGKNGVLRGNLWIVGHGDPEVNRPTLRALADAIAADGVKRITGRVIGDTGPFRRDWFAPGWKSYFPRYYVALPTALTFQQNMSDRGVRIVDPELRAARFLTTKLEARGVAVKGEPAADGLTEPVKEITSVASAPLQGLIQRMDLKSKNFYAEVLGKKLGSIVTGTGSIAAGAHAIDTYTDSQGVDFTLHDASGLSYANRVTADGMLRLLWAADAAPWGPILRASLPAGDQGTLEGRLPKITLRAKTGTLHDASALSGWVWLEQSQQWAEFSILSNGFSEWTAKGIEDRIVRAISQDAVDPT